MTRTQPDRAAIAEQLAVVMVHATLLAGLEPDVERICRGSFNLLHRGTVDDLNELIALVTDLHRTVRQEVVA